MREAVFVVLAVLVVTPAWSFSEKDLAKFEALNSCKNCDLSGASFSKADLRGANMNEADLSGAKLSEANLSKVDLSKANLSKADLRGANLNKTNLRGADLSGADLRGGNLNEAILCKTKMSWGEENSGCNGKPKKSWWQRLFGN